MCLFHPYLVSVHFSASLHLHNFWRNLFITSREPIVKEANDVSGSQALVADLAVRGVWVPQEEALFDIRVIDTDAKSYRTLSPIDVLAHAEKEKKLKYGVSCVERRAIFTPLCISVDGLFGVETEHFVRRVRSKFVVEVGKEL